jgi:hypothetical protein
VFSFVAGEKVKNLPQVKPGDLVTATYREGLVYEVKKGGTTGTSTTTTMAGARPGAMPAGVISEQTTVTVKIIAIDPKVPSVTFTGPAGNTYTMKVKDPRRPNLFTHVYNAPAEARPARSHGQGAIGTFQGHSDQIMKNMVRPARFERATFSSREPSGERSTTPDDSSN